MILLGIGDLAKRWNYIRQGVHEKMQYDSEFLRPIAIINTKVGLNVAACFRNESGSLSSVKTGSN